MKRKRHSNQTNQGRKQEPGTGSVAGERDSIAPSTDAPDVKTDAEQMKRIEKLMVTIASNMERTQIADYVHLINHPRRLIWTNLLAGAMRGVGIAIGFTVFATTILYGLKAIGALNLPIVGDYIADIIQHVQYQLEGGRPLY